MTMPVLFIGHGAPMNATRDNDFTQALKNLGSKLPRPKAVLVISAHWETAGTAISSQIEPQKINDFFGDHPELHALRYAPPGAPGQAAATQRLIPGSTIDDSRGIDHGAWAILIHLFPNADVPVYQMSVDKNRPLSDAYAIGRMLQALRDEGVLIVGSGNICHNTRAIDRNQHATPLVWNASFDQIVADALERSDLAGLAQPHALSPEFGPHAVPTDEHYAPFLYAMGATTEHDKLETVYAALEHASMSLRSLAWWPRL
jgi:4,5-DOPA dioxygenase extradiol